MARIQSGNWHIISWNGVEIVYYKNMKITDQFSITFDQQEYDLLNEMCSFASQFDFDEHNDSEIFNRVWDKISNAEHEIHFDEEDSWCTEISSQTNSTNLTTPSLSTNGNQNPRRTTLSQIRRRMDRLRPNPRSIGCNPHKFMWCSSAHCSGDAGVIRGLSSQ